MIWRDLRTIYPRSSDLGPMDPCIVAAYFRELFRLWLLCKILSPGFFPGKMIYNFYRILRWLVALDPLPCTTQTLSSSHGKIGFQFCLLH